MNRSLLQAEAALRKAYALLHSARDLIGDASVGAAAPAVARYRAAKDGCSSARGQIELALTELDRARTTPKVLSPAAATAPPMSRAETGPVMTLGADGQLQPVETPRQRFFCCGGRCPGLGWPADPAMPHPTHCLLDPANWPGLAAQDDPASRCADHDDADGFNSPIEGDRRFGGGL